MHPLDFCYWLQGFAELTRTSPTDEQWQLIKEHLATVFKKETPPLGGWKDHGIAQEQKPVEKADVDIDKMIDEIRRQMDEEKKKGGDPADIKPVFLPTTFPQFPPPRVEPLPYRPTPFEWTHPTLICSQTADSEHLIARC